MGCFPERLGDMGPLRITCRGCGREVTWPREVSIRRLGYSIGPVHAADKLKCSGCGAKGPRLFATKAV